jgi:hypothetical protein
MRKDILTTVFLCLMGSISIAQTGLKIGGNKSILVGDFSDNSTLTYRNGYQVGIWHRRPIVGKFGLCAEAAFLRGGGDVSIPLSGGQKNAFENKLFFANVPILATYQLNKVIDIEAGSCTNVFLPIRKTSGLQTFSTGLMAGLYLKFGQMLSSSIRYEHGLTSLNPPYRVNNPGKKGLFVRTIQLSLHFKFYSHKDPK